MKDKGQLFLTEGVQLKNVEGRRAIENHSNSGWRQDPLMNAKISE